MGEVDGGSGTLGPMTEISDLCPTCGHERGKPHRQPWFVRLFNLKPLPAACRESDGGANLSGWPGDCGCTHPFHGS